MNDAHPYVAHMRDIYSKNLLNIRANQALFYSPGE